MGNGSATGLLGVGTGEDGGGCGGTVRISIHPTRVGINFCGAVVEGT